MQSTVGEATAVRYVTCELGRKAREIRAAVNAIARVGCGLLQRSETEQNFMAAPPMWHIHNGIRDFMALAEITFRTTELTV
jgi:hypothetical protein